MWVQNRIGLPVTVAQAIRERKATVLLADRPVGETMRRFAEAFFLEWERTPAGYTLRMQPKVAAEEAATLEAEARGREAGLREAVEATTALSRLSSEGIDAILQQAGEAADAVNATAAAKRRYFMLSRYGHEGAALAAGEALAALSEAQRAAVLGGARLFASDRGGPGIVRISLRWAAQTAAIADGDGASAEPREAKPIDGLTVALRGHPALGRIEVCVSPTSGGEARVIMNTTIDGESFGLEDDGPMDARLAGWAKEDASLTATKLRKDSLPLPVHSSVRHSLADLLTSLHRRSGVPIVADGFREAASDGRVPDGADVKGWLKSLAEGEMAGTPNYAVRASDGWLALRRAKYWQRLAKEPLERAVVALERAAPTLDDVAAFAAGLTPVQGDNLGPEALVMDVPNAAVDGKVAFLRLWHALPATLRARAVADVVPLNALPPPALRLALDWMGGASNEQGYGDGFVAYLVPGGPPLPKGLALSVNPREEMTDFEFPPFSRRATRDPLPPALERKYRGFVATLQDDERSFVLLEVPLRERRP